MKTKSLHGQRGRPPKQKPQLFKTEMASPDDFQVVGVENPNTKPSVEILSCISYQKFRYHGENRPGKKYQEKDFMDLKLENLGDKVVRIVIICTDAENKELIHPNGLVGKDCHDGIYDKEYAIVDQDHTIKIPYLRTERIKTKKNEHSKIRNILKSRAGHLPSPYRERCESQCTDHYTFNRKFDTTKVCLGVIVTVRSHFEGAVNGSLHAISHVVNNASEKTSLGILKLSTNLFSAFKGGCVDVFTTEEGPAIESEKYVLYVTYETDAGRVWESDTYIPKQPDILYKRIITYRVPPLGLTDISEKVEATLHLDCPQNNQSCNFQIFYHPHGEEFLFFTPLKRSFTEELDDVETAKQFTLDNNKQGSDAVKAVLKDALQNRDNTAQHQNQKRSFTEDLNDVRTSKRYKLDNNRQGSDAVKAVLKETLKNRDADSRNSFPPTVQIIQASDDSVLVRRTEALEGVDHNGTHEILVESIADDGFEVLGTTHSKSVPSNSVLIIRNDSNFEPEDLRNVIDMHLGNSSESGKSVILINHSEEFSSDKETSVADSASRQMPQVTIVPESRSEENTPKKLHPQTSEKASKSFADDIKTRGQISHYAMASRKTHVYSKECKTDSPWAVGTDDETDMNIFNDLPFGKHPQLTLTEIPTECRQRTLKNATQPSRKGDSVEIVAVESGNKPKNISVLSNKEHVAKVLNNESDGIKKPSLQLASFGSLDLGPLTSEPNIVLTSELMKLDSVAISKMDLVTESNQVFGD